MAVQRGLNLTVLRPAEFALDEELGTMMEEIAAETGASIQESDDWGALEGAQVVYAKSWRSLMAYQDSEKEQKIRDRYRHWQVTEGFMARTPAASFMHCLPVRRNIVVSDQVLDSPRSVVVDQAENRLHVQKALLLHLLGEQQLS
jgi:N-acetylornithine carbamoyltransferase